MEKVWETIKKIAICIATALSAVALVLIGRSSKKRPFDNAQCENNLPVGSMSDCLTEEKIEEKCNEKRNETLERLSNTDARKLSETYGTVCDTITDGKIRFRSRCRELD